MTTLRMVDVHGIETGFLCIAFFKIQANGPANIHGNMKSNNNEPFAVKVL